MPGISRTARVGPNAVTRTLMAVREALGEGAAERLAEAAGHPGWLTDPPAEMVHEAAVAALHGTVRRLWPEETAALALVAGPRTGASILAHRTPSSAKAMLRPILPRLVATVLSRAIARHASTSAGSGRFAAPGGYPWRLEIAATPHFAGERAGALLCDWHGAVFEKLVRALVHHRATAHDACCTATGTPACVVPIRWDREI